MTEEQEEQLFEVVDDSDGDNDVKNDSASNVEAKAKHKPVEAPGVSIKSNGVQTIAEEEEDEEEFEIVDEGEDAELEDVTNEKYRMARQDLKRSHASERDRHYRDRDRHYGHNSRHKDDRRSSTTHHDSKTRHTYHDTHHTTRRRSRSRSHGRKEGSRHSYASQRHSASKSKELDRSTTSEQSNISGSGDAATAGTSARVDVGLEKKIRDMLADRDKAAALTDKHVADIVDLMTQPDIEETVQNVESVCSPYDPLTPMDAGISRSQLATAQQTPPPNLCKIQSPAPSPTKPSKSSVVAPKIAEVVGEETILADLKSAMSERRTGTPNRVVVKKDIGSIDQRPAAVNRTFLSPPTNEDVKKLFPIRTEPTAVIKEYVDHLQNLEFDYKKYTVFYCMPCRGFETTTAQWEEHLSKDCHRKSLWLWKQCKNLSENVSKENEALNQKEINTSITFCAGAEHVVEMSHNNKAMSYVCTLCQVVKKEIQDMLTHLSSFEHLDNFLEQKDGSSFRPPTQNQSDVGTHFRIVTPEIKKNIIDACKAHAMKNGRGHMKVYNGTGFIDWNPGEQSEVEEMEDRAVMAKMELLFNEDATKPVFPLRYKLIPVVRSVANEEYSILAKEPSKQRDAVIGVQYLVELWTPCRRVMPVYFCTLCDYLVANWQLHCKIMKHCMRYLLKHYKSIYEVALLESDESEHFRYALTQARSRILSLEGYGARIQHVVQVLPHTDHVFTPINARIAQRIVTRERMQITGPPRARKSQSLSPKKPSAHRSTETGHRPAKAVPSKAKSEEKIGKIVPKDNSTSPDKKSAQPSTSTPSSSASRLHHKYSDIRTKNAHSTAKRTTSGSSTHSRASKPDSKEASRRSSAVKHSVVDSRSKQPADRHRKSAGAERPKIYFGKSRLPMLRMEAANRVKLQGLVRQQAAPARAEAGRRQQAAPARAEGGRRQQARLSVAELEGLDGMLKTVNVDLGRRLQQSDVDMLRIQFGNDLIEQLLTEVAKQTNQASHDQIYAVQMNELRTSQRKEASSTSGQTYSSIANSMIASNPMLATHDQRQQAHTSRQMTVAPSPSSMPSTSQLDLSTLLSGANMSSMISHPSLAIYSTNPQLPIINLQQLIASSLQSTSDVQRSAGSAWPPQM